MDYAYFYVGFQGVLFFQVLLMLSQAFVNQRKEYYYYILYILLLMVYCHAMWSSFGAGLESLKLAKAKEPFFDKPVLMLSFFMYYRFARYFLDIPNKLPMLNRRVKKIEWVLIVYVVVEFSLLLVNGDGVVNESIFHLLSAFNFIASIWCIVKFLRQQQTPLNYFILAGVCTILIGGITSLILILTQPAIQFPILFVFPISVLIEIIIFTTGLAYKSRLVEQQKLTAERKLVKELQLKESLEKGMVELRNKIAGDLHDDLGSTLGSLGIYAEAARKDLDSGSVQKAKEILDRIYLLSTDSLKNLREMVWIITPGNEKWKDLNERMENYGKNVLSARSISFNMINSVEDKLVLSMVQRRNLYLIFKECLHNVLKHSNATKVVLSAEYTTAGNFVFSLVDDGIGTTQELSMGGHGLKNLQLRTNELHGVIQLKNNLDHGFCVMVEFPIHNK